MQNPTQVEWKTLLPNQNRKTQPFIFPKFAVTTMEPNKSPSEATNIYSTVIDVHLKIVEVCDIPFRYGIPFHYLRGALKALKSPQDHHTK